MNFDTLDAGEIQVIRDTVRRLLSDYVERDDPARWDADSILPTEILQKLVALGLCGLTIPEQYGGAGRNIPAALAVVEELSMKSLALAVPYIMSAFYGGINILECGTEEQRKEFLPLVAKGELLLAFGVTEPDVGGDVASVKTMARRRNGRVVINGSKRFITGANIADFIYTLVKTGDRKYQNLSIVLIPRTAKGVTISKIESIGMRGGAYTCDLTFDDVDLSESLIVGGEEGWDRGWEMMAGPGLDVERLEVAATALGLATAALHDAWEYSKNRKQFGMLICGHQSVRHMLADMQTELQACRLMVDHAARMAQSGMRCRTESAMAKLFVCERAKQIVLNSQAILGAYGCVQGSDMERLVRDILILPIAGGSSAIQRNNIASSLGLPKG
ncbi:MAG: acyl-CoA/acyl-ACP dehydrogenase [Burkholderiaceae bacterium]|nr:acyl-CoA/acyl-ACP dehydrogenase [Burkholderiaceae bacterium]